MSKHVARYAVTFGLAGCYLPDSHGGVIVASTRRDLADAIRSEIEMYDLPKSLFREVRIARLWNHISRHGSSVAHFHLLHGAYSLEFHGLTEEEANSFEAEWS